MSLTQTPISIRQTFSAAWAHYKANYRLLIASTFIFIASWVILEVIVILGQRFGIVLWLLAHSAFFIVFAGLQVGFFHICLAIIDGQVLTLSYIFTKLSTGFAACAAWALYAAGTLLGLALLILPGTRFGGRYIFYPLFIGEKIGPLQSLKLSANFTKDAQGYMARFFYLPIVAQYRGSQLSGHRTSNHLPYNHFDARCTIQKFAEFPDFSLTKRGGSIFRTASQNHLTLQAYSNNIRPAPSASSSNSFPSSSA